MCRRPTPEARTAHAKCMLKRHAEGLIEDPRHVAPRFVRGADNPGNNDDRLQESDINTLHRIEQSVREIRNIELLFQEPDLSSESESETNQSDNEVCHRVVPNHDMDLSDQEGHMSEDSDSD